MRNLFATLSKQDGKGLLSRPAIRVLILGLVLAAGFLINAPPAEAARYTCSGAVGISDAYIATGNIFMGLGNYSLASYWYGRAAGVMEGSC